MSGYSTPLGHNSSDNHHGSRYNNGVGGWEKEKRCLGGGLQRGTHKGSKSITALRAKASELKTPKSTAVSDELTETRSLRQCVHSVYELLQPLLAIELGYWSENRL